MQRKTLIGFPKMAAALVPHRATNFALASLILLSMLLIAIGTVPLSTALSALVIVWVSAVPGLLFLQGLDRSAVPFLPAAGLYYLVFFGLPIFATPLAYRTGESVVVYLRIVLEPMPPTVLLLAAGGIAMMFLAVYASEGTLFARMPRFRLPQANPQARTLNILLWLLLIVSLAFRYVPSIGTLPSIGQFLDPAGYLALGGFYLQWRAGKLSRGQGLLVLLVCLPLDLAWRVRYLFLTDLLWLPLFFGFVLWRRKHLRLLAMITAFGLMVSFAYSSTTAVRNNATSISGKAIAVFQYAASAFAEGGDATHRLKDGREVFYDRRISPLINRVGQVWIFQHVYEQSPEHVPHWGGESYRSLLTSFIPRIVYPAKPQERVGAEFGYRYGFTELQNDITSFNVPWMTELLANFGPIAVLLGMSMFGSLLGFLNRVFNAPEATDIEFLIGLTIIFRLCYQESNFSVMVGSLLPLFVSLYVYFRFGIAILERFIVRSGN